MHLNTFKTHVRQVHPLRILVKTDVKSIGKVKVQEKYNVRNLKVTKFKLH